MPIHDWTRVSSGGFHTFHQDWTIEICRTFTELKVEGLEPDVTSIRATGLPTPGGPAIADPPRDRQVARIESDSATYARKANRITVRHEFGAVVAVIEVVSPGNKDSRHGIRAFTEKVLQFLRAGVNLLVIDLFPPGPRDPAGIHQVIWENLTDGPFEPRPPDKPLTVASYDAGNDLIAFVDPVAVGDVLPDAPLFLAPGWHVKVPLERTYSASWDVTPEPIRERVASDGT
jgi:hypothetical protein